GRGVPGPGRRALTRVGTRVRGPGRAVLQSVDLPHLVLEPACLVDRLGSSGVCHRHLDDLDHPHRRVVAGGISLATTIGNEALRGVDGLIGVALVRGAVVVDVNVVRVAGILYQPVGVRTATELDRGYLLGVVQVGDIPDSDTPHTVGVWLVV